MIYKESIGLIGGFGGFATLDFFRRLLQAFNTGREREYPHIMMDNDFTMPSRTKALLYGDDIELVKEMISDSCSKLMNAGADHIILVCSTAHLFLPDVYERVPNSDSVILDIVDKMGQRLRQEKIDKCYVMATEATLKWQLFNNKFAPYNIDVHSPEEAEWSYIRNRFIESVKQDKITNEVKESFMGFIMEKAADLRDNDGKIHVILGCTELPLLADSKLDCDIVFHDPLENIIDWLKNNLK